MKISKRLKNNNQKVDKTKLYPLSEAITLLKSMEDAKFDETVELHIGLNVDPRHADQNIRGTISYPHGTGRKVKVLVLTKSKIAEAESAGADYFGLEEYVEKIKSGWSDVDVIITTPDAMSVVGKLGRILGPKGLMPSPKSGTVTNEVEKAVKEVKAGRIEFRVDKNGIIHIPVGKKSFEDNNLQDNITTVFTVLKAKKPSAVKGTYMKRITLTSTMGPGIKVDKTSLAES